MTSARKNCINVYAFVGRLWGKQGSLPLGMAIRFAYSIKRGQFVPTLLHSDGLWRTCRPLGDVHEIRFAALLSGSPAKPCTILTLSISRQRRSSNANVCSSYKYHFYRYSTMEFTWAKFVDSNKLNLLFTVKLLTSCRFSVRSRCCHEVH